MGMTLTTASGRSLVNVILKRNERAVRWTVATIELADNKINDRLKYHPPEASSFKGFRVFFCRTAAGTTDCTLRSVPVCFWCRTGSKSEYCKKTTVRLKYDT